MVEMKYENKGMGRSWKIINHLKLEYMNGTSKFVNNHG
jgi:hypothetical protein